MPAMAAAAQEQWYILYAVPDVGDDVMETVPLPSHRSVACGVASPTGDFEYPYIAAADRSGFLLLCGHTAVGLTLYVCDPCFRRTLGVFPHDDGINCRHCVGETCFTLFCTVDQYSWVEKEPDCSSIFSVDLQNGSVVQWGKFEGLGMPDGPDLSSRLVHAWQFPPELAEYRPLPGTISCPLCVKCLHVNLRVNMINCLVAAFWQAT
ncbi:unnamed protein product [Triticum turgidum subsp. durum]|uniref:Uncharacterized protein n=2 Tax=Triticum TaxID=4564 RepID=A0A9R1QSF6_TRITD|nr:unnamed protein product [Triticum aestivum]VAH82741.1 unnamed protein product [Triticum turgidum subsp. durum]